jgi:hypothetical protein
LQITPAEARLAFIDKVGAKVPSGSPLFAVPALSGTDLIVIAYRLGREIDRKPITCAAHNDYFLSPVDSDLVGAGAKFLAFSESYHVALISVLAPKSAVESQNNFKEVPTLNADEQKTCAS